MFSKYGNHDKMIMLNTKKNEYFKWLFTLT